MEGPPQQNVERQKGLKFWRFTTTFDFDRNISGTDRVNENRNSTRLTIQPLDVRQKSSWTSFH